MKANELTLDDLIYGLYPNGERYPHPFRIAAVDIYPTNRTPRILTVGGYGFQEEHLAPIPLTDEILKANGFEYFHKNFAALDRESPLQLEMVEWPNEEGIGLWMLGGVIKIRYVHELQHALRLCGIEKEIEL
jgi:hypothetical protein